MLVRQGLAAEASFDFQPVFYAPIQTLLQGTFIRHWVFHLMASTA